MRRSTLFCALAAGALAACTTVGGGGGASSASRDVLTAPEIAAADARTAYDAVRLLRPQFLRGRGIQSFQASGPEMPVVYVDGVRFGGIDTLYSIAAADVEQIRFVDARDATTRYGTGHAGGVLEVTTKS